jgi:hypothetical protein
LDDITKKSYLRAATRAISMELSVIYRGVASCERFISLLSVASIIYSIVALSNSSINDLNKISLAVYVFVVGLSEIIVIAVLLVIILIPVFCLLFVFYYCCCRQVRGDHINVP